MMGWLDGGVVGRWDSGLVYLLEHKQIRISICMIQLINEFIM